MNVGISFTLCSFFYVALLTIVFFSKKRFNSTENKLYSYLILTSLLGTIVGVFCYYFMKNMDQFKILNIIFSKLYLVYLVMWLSIFSSYIFYISSKRENKKKIIDFTIFFSLILSLIVIMLPLYYNNSDGVVYSYGPSTNLMYLISGIFIIVIIISLIKNIKRITQKKFFPILAFLIVGSIVMTIQKFNPGLLLITFGEAFITFLMYFTIENPDIQMINELYKNKRLVEENYEDKANFLFTMTEEVREPVFKINNIYKEMKDSNDLNDYKNALKKINSIVRELDFVINDVLDIATIDKDKIKFSNKRYNLNNLYNDIVIRVKSKVPSNVEFRSSIPNNIPYLYGDYIKLKQIVISILLNSIKKTHEGFIEFNIDTIERYDVCRIIISINDSGGGISIDKVNEILKTTMELSKTDIKEMEKMEINLHLCQKLIRIMGGNLMIRSDNNGSKVTLILDQRINIDNKNKDNFLANYEYYINTSKQILLISDNKELNSKIKKRLKNENISISISLYGYDAISKISYGNKYNLILILDDMKDMSGLSILKKLKNLEDFNTPSIIMLEKNKEYIKEEYIKDGFMDYLLLDNFEKEIEKVIYKY